MKIAVCGGHLTPALAVIDYILAHHPQDDIIFIGRKYSQESLRQLSNEAIEVEKRGIPFISLTAPRLNHVLSYQHLLLVPRMMLACLVAIQLLLKHRPDVVLSFGGYLALPLTIAAWLLQLPVITHEQTRAVGIANQIIGRLAKKIALTTESSIKYFPKQKCVVTGNPLRAALFNQQSKPAWIPEPITKPLLYITGGNQGSEILNSISQQAMRSLVSHWFVIHQCGNQTQRRNYKKELEQAKKQLPSTQQQHYVIKEWVSEAELGWIYQHAQVVIGRAGANTVAELIAHQLPAILIPLPFAHHDEQLLNAQYMKELGGAEILIQKELTAPQLLKTLQTVKKYHKTMKQQLAKVIADSNATEKIYDLLVAVT